MTDTIVLTIDNLGEAAEIEQGTWPAEAARGRHPSVTRALPRLLDLLDALALRATFFVEAINTREYPAALLEIAARGHEVGFHAGATSAGATSPPTTSRTSSTAASRPTRSSASTSGRFARLAAG